MWFFIAVVVLWVTTVLLGRQDGWVLPPTAQWGWWTLTLFACGMMACRSAFLNLPDRLAGLVGYTMFLFYYMTQSATYLTFLPVDTANPDMWPTVFAAANLIGPFILATTGCVAVAIQRNR